MSTETPQIPDDAPTPDETNDSTAGLVPTDGLGISKRQLFLVVGVVLVASIVVWRLRNSGGGSAADQLERAMEDDLAGEAEFEDDEDDEILVPNDPDDELAKDEAVIQALKASGKLGAS